MVTQKKSGGRGALGLCAALKEWTGWKTGVKFYKIYSKQMFKHIINILNKCLDLGVKFVENMF